VQILFWCIRVVATFWTYDIYLSYIHIT